MRLLADKAYSHPSIRKVLRLKRISHTILERSDQIADGRRTVPSTRRFTGPQHR